MANPYAKVVAGGRPAKMLLALADKGSSGLTAAEWQRLGIAICGDKGKQMATANQLGSNAFVERRVVLSPLGLAEVQRLLSERKAAEDAAFLETRNYG